MREGGLPWARTIVVEEVATAHDPAVYNLHDERRVPLARRLAVAHACMPASHRIPISNLMVLLDHCASPQTPAKAVEYET